MRLTTVVATIGRAGLAATLESLRSQALEGDEILVAGATPEIEAMALQYGGRFVACPPGRDWGHSERNQVSHLATGDYINHLDDDDIAAPGARMRIEHATAAAPGLPIMFRMMLNNGGLLWHEPVMRYGQVGTPMLVQPNRPEMFGTWAPRYGGDFKFFQSMKWESASIVWCTDVIAWIKPVPVHV